jgi:phage-related protein
MDQDFPRLKSGAVMQYPARREMRFSTQVLRFLDGDEQRFREYGSVLRRWVIQLSALDEEEMEALEAFFLSEQGGYGTFSFIDPMDDAEYLDCSLEDPEAYFEFTEYNDARTRLIVRQNR